MKAHIARESIAAIMVVAAMTGCMSPTEDRCSAIAAQELRRYPRLSVSEVMVRILPRQLFRARSSAGSSGHAQAR